MKHYYHYILYLVVFIAGCKPVVKNITSSNSYINIENGKEDTKARDFITPYKDKIDAEMNLVLGESEVEMVKVKDVSESLLGNFVADLVFYFGKSFNSKLNAAVLNNGGLRNSLPKGNITIGNVYELMPFDNELVLIEISGEELSPLFNMMAEKGGMPVSGMTMIIEKINGKNFPKEIKIGDSFFLKQNTYTIITSDYLAGGGDEMTFWAKGKITTTGKKVRDAIIDYIRLKTNNGEKLHPVLDKRISYFN